MTPRVLFVARRLAPDDPNADGQTARGWMQDLRRTSHLDVVAGYIRGRRLLPDGALGVDLCGRNALAASWAMRRATWRRAKAHEPDLIVSTAPDAPRCKRPSLLLVHELPSEGLAVRSAMARFDAWGVPSPAVREALIERGLSADAIHVIPPGITPPSRGTSSPDSLHIVCLGPIAPSQGIHVAIDAVARLAPVEKARVHLHVVGPIEDPVYYGQLVVQAHAQPVTLLPDAVALGPLLEQAGLVLHLPLLPRATVQSLGAAVLAGIPTIISEHAELSWITAGAGVCTPPGDVDAVRSSIQAQLHAGESSVRTSQAVIERWGREAAARRMATLLTSLTRKTGPGRR